MGIISGGRCCGRNILFDAVTGLNPPLAPVCVEQDFYVNNISGILGSPQPSYTIKTPDAVTYNINFPTDVIAVQVSGYGLLSATSNNSNPQINELHYYGAAADVVGWEIFDPNTLAYIPMNWRSEGSYCNELRCLEYSFLIDEVTYPAAQVYAINDPVPDPLNTPLALTIGLFTIPDAQFESELAELIRSMFGRAVVAEKTYDGTTFTIRLYNVQFVQTFPTEHPEFVKILIDLDPGAGNYIYAEPTVIECP
jgi:hypothetical protein